MSDRTKRLHWLAEDWPWWISRIWHKVVCLARGHTPIPDQCNLPEHDYCAWCSKSMPGQGERRVSS